MNFPLLKEVLTDPGEFIMNSELKILAQEVFLLILMPGIEGSTLNLTDIYDVIFQAAINNTSVNGVT